MNKYLSSNPFNADIVLAVVRVVTGLFMAIHGWEVFDAAKINEYAQWDTFKPGTGLFMAYLGKGAEFLGGILLILGLFTRIAAMIMLFTMAYISFFIGHGKVWYEDQHPFMFVLIALIYVVVGGGKWSLDRKCFD